MENNKHILINSNLNGLYSQGLKRGSTYVASKTGTGTALIIGKRGVNAIVAIVFRNGDTNYAIAIGGSHATAVQAVENNSVLSFKIDEYSDCRLISALIDITYPEVTA